MKLEELVEKDLDCIGAAQKRWAEAKNDVLFELWCSRQREFERAFRREIAALECGEDVD